MSRTHVETASALYELFGAGKLEEIKALLAPDFVLENPLPSIIPFGGRYEGGDGFVRYATGIGEGIRIEEFTIDRMLCDGEYVTVTGRERSQVPSTGKRYTMEWVHVLRISEAGIHSMREYNDTAAMQEAFEPAS